MQHAARAILLMLMLFTTAAVAQQGNVPPRQRMGDGGPGGQPNRPFTDKEITDWAKDKMPNLIKLDEVHSQSQRPRRPFLNVARMRYRAYRQIENDPDGLERMMKNIKLEDQAFGYIIDLQKAQPEEKPAIREKIRSAFREVFEDYLEQRAERLENLKKRLEDEESRIEAERAELDTRVEGQLDRFGVNLGATTRESSEPARNTMAAPERGQ